MATDEAIRAWTVRRRSELVQLFATGAWRPGGFVTPEFFHAYSWMADQMTIRIGPPPSPQALPVWLWVHAQGRRSPRPDLRRLGWAESGSEAYLVELLIPVASCVLSDYQKWHLVLSGEYVPRDLADAQRWESADAPDTMLLEDSWTRVFDLDRPSDLWEPVDERQIQGTVWEITLEQLVSVRRFKAR